MLQRLERTHCTRFMDILNRQFGLAIAFLLPGFIALAGIAPLVPVVAGWLQMGQTANLGAPVYAILAATASGMIVSCVRWFLLDSLLTLTGVPAPVFNAQALEHRPAALDYLVEAHYRYYQFYANSIIAVIWTYSIYRVLGVSSHLGIATDIGAVILCVVLFAGSRDALTKYRSRSTQLFVSTPVTHSENRLMTNGIDHNQGNGTKSEKPTTPTKPGAKPVPTTPANAGQKDRKESKS